jgi:hypothetical protein
MARSDTRPASGATASSGPGRRGLLRRRKRSAASGPGRLAQFRDVYRMTRRSDPSVTWWVLGAFVLVLALGVLLGLLLGSTYSLVVGTILGLMFGTIAGLFILARRAERAAYSQLEGQPGAAGAALRVLRRGWTVEEQPVAIDPRTQDTVFRAVGRPGVVLVSDGPAHRVSKLLDTERRRVTRVLPDVPVHVIQSGRGDGQVPVGKLPRKVMRLRPTLTKQEVSEVQKRLRALGGLRPPVPKGIDPLRARPNRRAVRGR